MLLVPLLLLLAGPSADPRPKAIEPGSWIDTNEYPRDALIRGATGTVAFSLRVDTQGIPVSCTVTLSSGDASLDAATCTQLQAHARFEAPIGPGGKPIASAYSNRVTWQLPNDPPPLAPATDWQLAPPQRWAGRNGRATGLKLPEQSFPIASASPAAARCPTAVTAPPPALPAGSLPVDPRLRSGRLPNGLRYMILCNSAEPESVSMRLRIAGGSIGESDGERGYTHLLEHMVFRGSTNVPDGEFERSLEALGLRLGDGNSANTTVEDTVFSLDYPPDTRTAIDNGLTMLREIADRALITPQSLNAERGVVLAEERTRDTPDQRLEDARLAFLLAGRRAATRSPIGTRASISAATADMLRAFYKRNYRPDMATLVVVGALDIDDVERRIRQQFGDWKASQPAPAPVDFGKVSVGGESARLVVAPGASDRLELYWTAPFDPSLDTIAHRRRDLARDVALLVLNERLGRASEALGAGFAGAAAWRSPVLHSADVTGLSITPLPGSEPAAIAGVVREKQRLVTFGVTQAEMDRATSRIRTLLSNAAASAASVTSPYLASALVQSVANDDVFSSAAQTLALFEQTATALSRSDIKQAANDLFAGSGPRLFASRTAAPPQAEAKLRSALAAATQQKVEEDAAEAPFIWPYTSFGPPGRVIAREEIADLGVTIIRFANRNSLVFKPASSATNEIMVNLAFGAGLGGLPVGLEHAYWLLNSGAFLEGGLAKAAPSEIGKQFSAKAVSASFLMAEDRFQLVGTTRLQDLDSELQLLTAYVTDPAYRPEALRRTQVAARGAMAQFDASAVSRSGRDLQFVLHDRDRRWSGYPAAADIDAVRPGDLAALLDPALSGPIELVMVGNLTVDQAIAAAASTIGALPRRSPRPPVRPARFPAIATPFTIDVDQARSDQGIAVAAWPTPGFFSFPSSRDARGVQMLAQIVQSRLINGLREADGLTYAPTVIADQSLAFPTYGTIVAQVEIAPADMAKFYAALTSIMTDLAKNPVPANELERARNPLFEQSRSAYSSMPYWLNVLAGVSDDRRRLDVIRSRLGDISLVSAADIQRLARVYVRADAAVRFTIGSRPKSAKLARP